MRSMQTGFTIPTGGNQADPDTDPQNPDYEGPEDGPFRCDNCTHFQAPNQCDHPTIIATRQGMVDAGGCCKFFDTLKQNGARDDMGKPVGNDGGSPLKGLQAAMGGAAAQRAGTPNGA